MIEVKNLSRTLGQKLVLNNVSINCEPGELTVLLGPNGAGKSTLLKSISGEFESPDKSILIKSRYVNEWSKKEMSKLRSVMPQSADLSFDFSVMEVVLMGRSPHNEGIESENDFKICKEVLEEVECLELADRKYTTLSGGEKQRITLARVLAQIKEEESPVLLMDEPIASLDPEHQKKTMESAKKVAQMGGTVFVILHDFNMAANFADKIYFIKNGEITVGGSPKETMTVEKIYENFNVSVQIIEHPTTAAPQVIFL